MSAAASQSLPRTPSSRRAHNYAPSQERQPLSPTSASASTSSKTAVPPSPRRAASGSQAPPSRNRSTSGAQGQLSHVAQRDVEQTNLAARPSASRRSESQDRPVETAKVARSQSVRTPSTVPSSSRPGHAKRESEVPSVLSEGGDKERQASTANSTGGGTGRHASVANSTGGGSTTDAQPRRRTTVDATTGTWELGKTIGAGSMGKVKLAKNKETGEQVGIYLQHIIYTCAD